MKLNKLIFLCLVIVLVACMSSCKNRKKTLDKKTELSNSEQIFINALDTAQIRYIAMLKQIDGQSGFPYSLHVDGSLNMVDVNNWTSGFFASSLWYLYEYSQNEFWKENAEKYTRLLESGKNRTNTHDMGFIYYCSFGNAYRLTGDAYYNDIVLTASESLIKRYDPVVGCIRSWDWGKWNYPVIIDNMMNLEMLSWASKESEDSKYMDIVKSHADKTLENHFREDYSSCHVVDYNKETGEKIAQYTFQGAFDKSVWARGQAWGLYGFTMVYRETKDERYLEQAENIADFIIPNLPNDFVPYWDFLAPNIPNEPRDASAAAVMASALLELATYVPEKKDRYNEIATKLLLELSSERYLTNGDNNNNFVLNHSTGHLPANSEIDKPLNYADYYFIEALLKYLKLNEVL